MQKIPSLFVRDYENTGIELTEVSTMQNGHGIGYRNINKGRFLATNQVTPGCEWVINGEGIATRKWDGTCCKIENGILYKRYDAKHGKTPPEGFMPAQEPDPITGHWPGWLKVGEGPEDRWITEAHENFKAQCMIDGTYEAIGPKINGNREKLTYHRLIKHDAYVYRDVPRDFEGLRHWFGVEEAEIEGIVFHHPDGRMCKIKRSDFGLKW